MVRSSRAGHGVVVNSLCGEVGHVSGACPTSYSARASADVGPAEEPSQPEYSSQELEEAAREVEKDFLASSKQCEGGPGTPERDTPSPSPPPPGEADVTTVKEDLQLSSDSDSITAMSDDEETAQEPPAKESPAKDPPSEGWFDFCEGFDSESSLKRSASGDVSDRPTPSPRSNKKAKAQEDDP